MSQANAYAAAHAGALLAPTTITRREPGPSDVRIEIAFCGVCHSDLHRVRDEWGGTRYPCVPGHEIVGRVGAVGADVTRFKPGDLVGVGVLVDSCRQCASCGEGLEQFCEKGSTETYNSPDKRIGGHTLGGYSTEIVVDEGFVLRIPPNLGPAAAAPLLYAGITTYSPLRHWGIRPGQKVGIVGLGGLGHMGVKLASAMGAEVVLFTTSPGKADDAKRFGAQEVVVSSDAEAMAKHAGSFDLILDTVSAKHDVGVYLALLKRDATLVAVGVPPEKLAIEVGALVGTRRSLAGSTIGGLAETQQMLDFCAAHGIVCDIEMIAIDAIEESYARMLRSDVKYRFVIDMASLGKAP